MTYNNHLLSGDELVLLKSFIGEEILYCKHEPFQYTTASYGKVGFATKNGFYKIACGLQDCDLMGQDDELAFLSVAPSNPQEFIGPYPNSPVFIDSDIKRTLKDIIIVNNKIEQYEGEKLLSTLEYTKAIIFDFGDKQLGFEQGWYYQEIISVLQGKEVLSKVAGIDKEWGKDAWGEGYSSKNTRTILHLK